jgi:tetratricopeptide (TPR) repeat protein
LLRRRRHQKQLAAAIQRGRQLHVEGKDEENLAFLAEAIQQFPKSGELRLLYGTAILVSQPEVGLSEIEKATEIDSSDPVLLTRAARLMFSMKQFDHARAYFKRASALAPQDFIFGPELLNLKSNFAAIDGEDARAEEGLRLAMELEPNMEVLALDLAKFLSDRGRRKEALEVIAEALQRAKETKYLKRLRDEILHEADPGPAASA